MMKNEFGKYFKHYYQLQLLPVNKEYDGKKNMHIIHITDNLKYDEKKFCI